MTMTAQRDMTEKQFKAALERNGIRPHGVMGYHDVGYGVSVSIWNAGTDNRRRILAYLLKEQAQARKRRAEEEGRSE